MKLTRYLKKNGLTISDFARMVEVTESSVSKWCRGERTPRGSHMRKIVAATAGEVSPNDFLTHEKIDGRKRMEQFA